MVWAAIVYFVNIAFFLFVGEKVNMQADIELF